MVTSFASTPVCLNSGGFTLSLVGTPVLRGMEYIYTSYSKVSLCFLPFTNYYLLLYYSDVLI
jgi:hypothetical protein